MGRKDIHYTDRLYPVLQWWAIEWIFFPREPCNMLMCRRKRHRERDEGEATCTAMRSVAIHRAHWVFLLFRLFLIFRGLMMLDATFIGSVDCMQSCCKMHFLVLSSSFLLSMPSKLTGDVCIGWRSEKTRRKRKLFSIIFSLLHYLRCKICLSSSI